MLSLEPIYTNQCHLFEYHPLTSLIIIIHALTQPDFLNALVAQLWPNINVAVGQIAKDSVEPILASTLPTPLCNLRFVKFDMGNIPMTFSHVDMNKISDSTIRLDMDMDWEGNCDIELDGSLVPKVVSLCHGRGLSSDIVCS